MPLPVKFYSVKFLCLFRGITAIRYVPQIVEAYNNHDQGGDLCISILILATVGSQSTCVAKSRKRPDLLLKLTCRTELPPFAGLRRRVDLALVLEMLHHTISALLAWPADTFSMLNVQF